MAAILNVLFDYRLAPVWAWVASLQSCVETAPV